MPRNISLLSNNFPLFGFQPPRRADRNISKGSNAGLSLERQRGTETSLLGLPEFRVKRPDRDKSSAGSGVISWPATLWIVWMRSMRLYICMPIWTFLSQCYLRMDMASGTRCGINMSSDRLALGSILAVALGRRDLVKWAFFWLYR